MVEIDSQPSQRLNVLGLMTRGNQLHSYVSTQSITREVVIACIDAFFPIVTKRTVVKRMKLADDRKAWKACYFVPKSAY